MNCAFLLLFALNWSGPSEELVQRLFASSWTTWESILAEHKDELDRAFFRALEDRLAEDEEKLDSLDAAKFATLGDRALCALGRTPRYSRALAISLHGRGNFPAPVWLAPELVRAGRSDDFFASPGPRWGNQEPSRSSTGTLVDLTVEADWKLVASSEQSYEVGEMLREVRYELGDHRDLKLEIGADRSTPMLRRGKPELCQEGIWTGVQRGRLIWVGSRHPDSELQFGGERIAGLSDSPAFWKARLGAPQVRLQRLDCNAQVHIFRATMADIGLETQDDQITGLILMEPGQLKTELLRLGNFRLVLVP